MLRRALAASAATGLAVVLLTAVRVPPAGADSGWAERLGSDFRAAHQVTRGQGVTVALVGTGVAADVSSLRGVLGEERDFVGTPRPKKVYGTLMASWIAGGGPGRDNPFGMRGLAPGVRLLPVRVAPDGEDPGAARWLRNNDLTMTTAKGIRHAADEGAQVIAVEPTIGRGGFWGNSGVTVLHDAVAYARSKNAVVIAGGAGVRDKDDLHTRFSFPAAVPGVIGVGAVDEDGDRYSKYSEKSSSVLVSAPGFKLPAVGPGNRLYTYWGSASTVPWVAATAAFVKAEYPGLTPAQVARAIAASARHPKGRGAYDTEIGFGVVNPDGALKEARRLAGQGRPQAVAKTGVVGDEDHFGGGAPDEIGAARHPVAAIAGFPALILAGLLALAGSFLLLRRRRAPVGASTPGPGAEPVPVPTTGAGSAPVAEGEAEPSKSGGAAGA